MKKFILFLTVMVMTVMSANAQKALEEQKFFDNTYIGLYAGGATELTFDNVFPGNVTFGLRLGKAFTPVFGIEVDGSAWLGSTTANEHQGFKFDNPFGTHNAIRATNLGINGLMNINNLFAGYNGEPRRFEFNVVAGLGWNHIYNPSTVASDANSIYAKTAVDVMWNLGKKKAHAIFVQPGIYWNLNKHGYDGISFMVNRAQFTVSIGYIYKFKTSNGTHNFKQYDIAALNEEINLLCQENQDLKNRPAEVKEVHIEKVVEREVIKVVSRDYVVCFAQKSAVLTEAAKVSLNSIPENTTVKIVASASPEGAKSYNQKLSERRAEAVKTYLNERGVKVIEAIGTGSQTTESNRIALVTIQ